MGAATEREEDTKDHKLKRIGNWIAAVTMVVAVGMAVVTTHHFWWMQGSSNAHAAAAAPAATPTEAASAVAPKVAGAALPASAQPVAEQAAPAPAARPLTNPPAQTVRSNQRRAARTAAAPSRLASSERYDDDFGGPPRVITYVDGVRVSEDQLRRREPELR